MAKQEETNFYRIMSLLLKVAPVAVREFFDSLYDSASLSVVLSQKKEILRDILNNGVLKKAQWDLLFPKHGPVSSIHFDLSLMILLLMKLCGVDAPQEGWRKLPHSTDTSYGADLLRIRHYRNSIAHATDCYMHNSIFKKSWMELKKAIINIGGSKYEVQINELYTFPLGQSEFHAEFLRELRELQKDRGIISANIQQLHQLTLELWKKEDNIFVRTRATNEIEKQIRDNNFVFITGPLGSGKSAHLHHFALQYQSEGYVICPVESPDELIRYWIPQANQLFVIDDPFGTHAPEISSIDQWRHYLRKINMLLEHSSVKIIASVRTNIMKDKLVKDLLLQFQQEIIDIMDEQICLSISERSSIFTSHMKSCNNMNEINEMLHRIKSCDINCFPLLCRLFASSTEVRCPESFFKFPMQVLVEEIKSLKTHDPCSYFCLIFCMMKDNKLNENVFQMSNNDENMREMRETFLELCKLHRTTSRIEISSKLKSLCNTFLKKEGYRYRFIHDFIQDAVACCLSPIFYESVLKFCSSKFFKERILLQSIKDRTDACHREPFIVIGENLESNWGKRLIAEIKEGHWHNVFHNKCLVTSTGDEILADMLKKSGNVIEIMCKSTRKHDDPKHGLIFSNENIYSKETISKLNAYGCSALHWAVATGLTAVVKVTLESIKGRLMRELDSYIPLVALSCVPENINMLEVLVEAGADVNQWGDEFGSPLSRSIKRGHIKIAKVLIEKGADLNELDSDGWAPLHFTAKAGLHDMANALVNAGADVNVVGECRCTPLHLCAEYGRHEIAKLLLDKRADPHKIGRCGQFPLHISAEFGHYMTADVLLQNGADVNARDESDKTPCFYAFTNYQFEVWKLLIENGGPIIDIGFGFRTIRKIAFCILIAIFFYLHVWVHMSKCNLEFSCKKI